MTKAQLKSRKYYEQFLDSERQRIEAYRRADKDNWITMLESLLLDAEDVALTLGDWGLCECTDRSGNHYQSQTCSDVIDNIRNRTVVKNNKL